MACGSLIQSVVEENNVRRDGSSPYTSIPLVILFFCVLEFIINGLEHHEVTRLFSYINWMALILRFFSSFFFLILKKKKN